MTPPTYESQTAWNEIQKFLPESQRFDETNKPTEEWWENRGHTIHLDRMRNPDAKIRVIMNHGVGTNGRQMSLLLGIPLLKAGFEAVAIDMPNYGMTKVASGTNISYDDWVNIADDFINFELEQDPRPIVLYGLSAGGMLTYHIAALNKKVKGIIGMTFLDQRIQQVRDETSRNILLSRIGVPLADIASKVSIIARFSMPMSMASKMWALVNNPAALKVFFADKTSAGNWTSIRFLSTYMNFKPAIEPEEFDVCPILLTQPMKDRWTRLYLSQLFLKRVKKVPVKIVELENAGHYPLEHPGLEQMKVAIIEFLREIEISSSI